MIAYKLKKYDQWLVLKSLPKHWNCRIFPPAESEELWHFHVLIRAFSSIISVHCYKDIQMRSGHWCLLLYKNKCKYNESTAIIPKGYSLTRLGEGQNDMSVVIH